ncbi:MAG: MATE family efflux transporter [Dehalococcoidales bacterium]|nr:MAG: MATE family efflux transporter [Dehalococcoidales bacterium]
MSRNIPERDWTQGNIFRNLVSLSWPIIVSSSFNILGPVIDMVWVGKLGAASIAGVGIASMTVMAITSARMGLAMGTRAIVARFIGAGDKTGANHVAQQAFVISGTYVVIVASLGIFFAEPIIKLFGVEADVVSEGAAYMRIMFVGSIAMSFRMLAEGIMQASGDTVIPMRITMMFRVFHAILSPFLIFGIWIFPKMGVSGAATANVVSQALGAVISYWILFTGRSRLSLSLKNFSLDLGIIWRIVKIGIPGAIMAAERAFGDMVLMWFMSPFGTIAVAGHSLIQRIEAVLRMPCMGLGNGSGVMVGQNLGAGKPDRAEKSGWFAVGIAQGYAMLIALIILLWAESIISVFNSDPEVMDIAGTFLRIAAAGYLFMGLYFVLQNAINGSGDTLPPMLITLLNFWLVQVPLAFVLPKYTGLEANGVRWAIVAGWVAGAIAYAIYFKVGRWKRKRI